jgi:hypothetical protein
MMLDDVETAEIVVGLINVFSSMLVPPVRLVTHKTGVPELYANKIAKRAVTALVVPRVAPLGIVILLLELNVTVLRPPALSAVARNVAVQGFSVIVIAPAERTGVAIEKICGAAALSLKVNPESEIEAAMD